MILFLLVKLIVLEVRNRYWDLVKKAREFLAREEEEDDREEQQQPAKPIYLYWFLL